MSVLQCTWTLLMPIFCTKQKHTEASKALWVTRHLSASGTPLVFPRTRILRSSRGWVDADAVSCRKKQLDDMFDVFKHFNFANIWALAGVVRPRSSTAGWRCSQPWARSLSKCVCIAGWDSDLAWTSDSSSSLCKVTLPQSTTDLMATCPRPWTWSLATCQTAWRCSCEDDAAWFSVLSKDSHWVSICSVSMIYFQSMLISDVSQFSCFIWIHLRGLNLVDLGDQLFPPKSRRSPWCPKRAGRRSLLSLASSSWLSTRRPPSQAGFMLFAVRGLGLFASWHFLKAIMERATSALAWSASATPSRILRQGPSYMTTVITWYCMQLCTFFI